MSRLPFDAGKARGAEPAKPADGPWSVSQLASAVSEAIERSLPARVVVLGEVSQPRLSTHLYFTLKDAHAGVQAVLFASTLRRLAHPPEHGQQVIAHCKVSYYAPQGRVSLIVDRIEPVGRGALEQQLRELCDELRAQGWFEDARKRLPPTLPRRVAVITSLSGAALQDVLDTLKRRCPAIGVLVVGVKVQGDSAAGQVVKALRWISAEHQRLGVDAVIVTRGGGSMEDLWGFNDREVALATLECAIPVIAAIGHETDTTIIELVADVRAATPTQAAMRASPDALALHRQLDQLADRMRLGMRRSMRDARTRWIRASEESVLSDPHALFEPSRERLDDAQHELLRALKRRLLMARSRLDRLSARMERHRPAAIHAARREQWKSAVLRLRRAQQTAMARHRGDWGALGRELEAVGPRAVLHRGYTCTLDTAGQAVRSAVAVNAGDRVRTITADGAFDSVVGGSGVLQGEVVGRPAEPRIRRRRAEPQAQPGLFGESGEQGDGRSG